MKAVCWFVITGLVVIGSIGCASTPSSPPIRYTGDPVVDGKTAIERGPARDRVLWQERTALACLRRGQFAEAQRLLDDALATIGGVKTADKNSRQARGLFHGESKKNFVGEPYERVMAYYYRGILYWMNGEPDNARACFRSAQLEDGDAENKQYASDYVLLDYLDGLASRKLAADGSDAFNRAQQIAKNNLPPYDVKANVLFFIDFGRAPEKYATGNYQEQLRFREVGSSVRKAVIKLGDRSIVVPAYDDLYYQATTRGGRVMDHILAGKAVFKTASGVVGGAALVSGMMLAPSRDRSMQTAGLGLLAFGLVSEIVSAATVPTADTRAWDNLPQFLGFSALTLPPGQHVVKVEFQNAHGVTIPQLTKTLTLNLPAGARDSVIYLSEQSSNF